MHWSKFIYSYHDSDRPFEENASRRALKERNSRTILTFPKSLKTEACLLQKCHQSPPRSANPHWFIEGGQ